MNLGKTNGIVLDRKKNNNIDAVRMIEAFLAYESRGKEIEDIRPNVDDIWKLTVPGNTNET